MTHLTDWIVAIGIPSIVACLIYIGRKLQVLSQLDDSMSKVKQNIKVIADFLIGENRGFDHGRLQAYSPLKLTDGGQRFLNDIGFISVFDANREDFFNCIRKEGIPLTDYDIETSSIKSVLFLFDRPYFNSIKDYLYNHPNEQKNEFIKVAGIYVRDRYMEYIQQTSKV